MLCIWSNACASCSLSTGADEDRETNEPRRDLRPRLGKEGGPMDVLGESCEDITILPW